LTWTIKRHTFPFASDCARKIKLTFSFFSFRSRIFSKRFLCFFDNNFWGLVSVGAGRFNFSRFEGRTNGFDSSYVPRGASFTSIETWSDEVKNVSINAEYAAETWTNTNTNMRLRTSGNGYEFEVPPEASGRPLSLAFQFRDLEFDMTKTCIQISDSHFTYYVKDVVGHRSAICGTVVLYNCSSGTYPVIWTRGNASKTTS
jgi:hypothetical protein